MNKRDQLKSDSLHQHVANMLNDGYTTKRIQIETGHSWRHIVNVVAKIIANPEMYNKVEVSI